MNLFKTETGELEKKYKILRGVPGTVLKLKLKRATWPMVLVCVTIVSVLLINCVRRNVNPLYVESEKMPLSEFKDKGRKYVLDDAPDSALITYSVIQNKYRPDMSVEDKRIVATAYNNSGYIYTMFFADYVQAYAMLLHALEIAEEIGYDKCKANTYLNIGNIYANYEDEEAAVDCYRKSLAAAAAAKEYETMYIVLCNLLTRALPLDLIHEKGVSGILPEVSVLDTADTGKFPLRNTCVELVRAYHSEADGRYDEAQDLMEKASASVDAELTPERFGINILSQKAYLQAFHKDYDKAIATLRRVAAMSRDKDVSDLEGICYINMAEYFRKAGMKDSADYYKLKGYDLTDSIMNKHKLATIKDMKLSSRMRAANMEIHDLISDKRMQFYIILILSGAGAIILSLLIWILMKHRRLRQSHEALYMQIQRNIDSPAPADAARLPKEDDGNVAEAKYIGSSLGDADKQTIYAAIEQVMENTELICAEDFSLDRLAAMLDVKSKHISQVLTEEGTSFNAMRNDYRVREACRRMADRQHYGNYT